MFLGPYQEMKEVFSPLMVRYLSLHVLVRRMDGHLLRRWHEIISGEQGEIRESKDGIRYLGTYRAYAGVSMIERVKFACSL